MDKELRKLNIMDSDEILADFEEHIEFKLGEGKTEEEIIKKIGNPIDIANDYSLLGLKKKNTKKNYFAFIGLAFMDMFMILFFILLWSTVLV